MRFKIQTTSNKTYLVDEDKIQTPTSFVKDAEALEENIEAVVFDRGGFIYHGVVKELAEAAREAGLKF